MVRLEVPGHVLQHFWDLANVEAEVRRKSAVSLVMSSRARGMRTSRGTAPTSR